MLKHPQGGKECAIALHAWEDLAAIPDEHVERITKVIDTIVLIMTKVRSAHWLVTSIVKSMNGTTREGTHGQFKSGDVAPLPHLKGVIMTPGQPFPSPALDSRQELLAYLAGQTKQCGIFAEGDHFHVQGNVPPHVYAAPSYRPFYQWDKMKRSVSKRVMTMIHVDGSAIPVSPELVKQWMYE